MRIELDSGAIDVFTISPRTLDQTLYWRNIQSVVRWSEQYNCTGILIFTGNDTYVDPWLVAHTVLLETERLCPLIAINPIYMHPFSAAKMVSSFAYLYKRRVYLNMVTGTALSHLDALADNLSHDDRYERLMEYMEIIRSLLSNGRRTTLKGKYYNVSNLQLLPGVPESLMPIFVLAGQSDMAQRVAREFGAIGMQMLQPMLDREIKEIKGMHFGVITRPTETNARKVADRWFPNSETGQQVLDFSMKNTDSVWKKKLNDSATADRLRGLGYWLAPFRNFQADCPYFVGDYNLAANLLVSLIEKGISTFILDLPASEEEFYHADIAFKMADQKLAGKMALMHGLK